MRAMFHKASLEGVSCWIAASLLLLHMVTDMLMLLMVGAGGSVYCALILRGQCMG